MASTKQAGNPWYRSGRFKGFLVYAAGLFVSSCFFFGDVSLPGALARSSFFLVALPFLALGVIPGLIQLLGPLVLAFLCAAYFLLVYLGALKLRDSLSSNRVPVLCVFIFMVLVSHGMADRLLSFYLGEAMKKTAPQPVSAEQRAASESLLEQAIKEDEAEAEMEGLSENTLPVL